MYGRCHAALAPGGVLLGGDEVRAEDEAEYLSQVSAWAEHMRWVMSDGLVAESFHDALHGWIDRNVRRFEQSRSSGDDCHETIAAQIAYFRQVGFAMADVSWQPDMWAMLRGVR